VEAAPAAPTPTSLGSAVPHLADRQTPALVVDADALEANLADMAARRPGATLRPHVKAHKTTALAHRQAAVMGYEGHLQALPDVAERARLTGECMARLLAAHADVGGDVVSGGGTGTSAVNTWVTEMPAGSYALMDSAYTAAGVGYRQALHVLGTVVSASAAGPDMPAYAVADVGLKALGMDHGNPSIASAPGASGATGGGHVWFRSDEHVTFAADAGTEPARVGDHVLVVPAHIDPTAALHERMHLVRDGEVLDTWPVDLRGW
jgi:D-serine deaminase-like pyridoxal phosphate-dependent protein